MSSSEDRSSDDLVAGLVQPEHDEPADVVVVVGDQYQRAFVPLAFLGAFLAMSILLSVSALVLEEFSFRRYAGRRDVLTLFVYAVLENFGYRQLNDFWKLQAFGDLARRRRGWGEMRRRGFGLEAPPP